MRQPPPRRRLGPRPRSAPPQPPRRPSEGASARPPSRGWAAHRPLPSGRPARSVRRRRRRRLRLLRLGGACRRHPLPSFILFLLITPAVEACGIIEADFCGCAVRHCNSWPTGLEAPHQHRRRPRSAVPPPPRRCALCPCDPGLRYIFGILSYRKSGGVYVRTEVALRQSNCRSGHVCVR